MKHVLFTAILLISAHSSAALNCQPEMDSLKSQMGDCNFGNQAACDNVCYKIAPVVSSQPSVASCSASDLQLARNKGRQDVINDLRANASRQDFAYGVDEADCLSRVKQRVEVLRENAIQDCNNQANTIKNCKVMGEPRITTATASIASVKGIGEFELKKKSSTEEQCRSAALERARQDALSSCKSRVGYDCTLSADSSAIVTHKIDNGFLASDKRKCKAEIVAIPPSNVRVQCTAEIKAVNSAIGL